MKTLLWIVDLTTGGIFALFSAIELLSGDRGISELPTQTIFTVFLLGILLFVNGIFVMTDDL